MTARLPKDGRFDSYELDREIRAQRRKAQRLVPVNTLTARRDPTQSNQELTAEELKRRAVAKARIAGEKSIGRWPKPRKMPNGRWQANCIHRGQAYCRTFDTYSEAEDFILQVKESES